MKIYSSIKGYWVLGLLSNMTKPHGKELQEICGAQVRGSGGVRPDIWVRDLISRMWALVDYRVVQDMVRHLKEKEE